MPWIVGVDGCRGGWVSAWLSLSNGTIAEVAFEVFPFFQDILSHRTNPKVLAVDMPIGLLSQHEPGGRSCDREARKRLGRRASSIFSPPTRDHIKATHYEQVRSKGVSRQSFHLFPKIRELDEWLTPTLQRRVFEAHPELAFAKLAGHPMVHNKKTVAGQRERLQALAQAKRWPFSRLPSQRESLRQRFPRRILGADDILDAWALGWIALRIYLKQAERIPSRPQTDAKGLRMEIWC